MLTVGMLTHDDYHGVYFTLNAIRLYQEDNDKVNFVVVDNNPDSDHGKALKHLCEQLPRTDYHTVRNVTSTSFRNLVFELAPTDQVLCMDGHVLLWPKALSRLIKFYEENPQCRHDLIHGPMISERGNVIATHMEPSFRGWNFGIWGNNGAADDERGPAFEIPMHGMGLFACSRQGWLRFSPGLRYFGAEEGTIHEKFRLHGRKAWCLPFLRWLHRFGRPGGAPYKNSAESKVKNYLTAFNDVRLSLTWIEEYFTRHLNGDLAVAHQRMEELMEWAKTLPPPSVPETPEGYKPFLGLPIEILD